MNLIAFLSFSSQFSMNLRIFAPKLRTIWQLEYIKIGSAY